MRDTVVLTLGERSDLRRLLATHGETRAAEVCSVGRFTLARAIAGFALRRATAMAIRVALAAANTNPSTGAA